MVGKVAGVLWRGFSGVPDQYDDGGSNGGTFNRGRGRLGGRTRRQAVTGGHLRAPTGNLRAAVGEILDFCRWKFGGVRVATFRVALRVFLVELSRTKPVSFDRDGFGSRLCRQYNAHRHTETCSVDSTQFPTTKIKDLA